jgi:hypothetical protein
MHSISNKMEKTFTKAGKKIDKQMYAHLMNHLFSSMSVEII